MPKPPVPAEYRPGPAHGSGRRRWAVIGPVAAAACVVLLAVANGYTVVLEHPVPEATSFAPELPPKPLSSGLSSSSSSAGPN